MFYRIQVWRLSWPFHSLQTVTLKIVLNNHSSVRSFVIIHQNEIVTNSTGIWADIWIKDLIPIAERVPPWNTCRSVDHRVRSLPKP
ncbi:hypothetical protein AVEN_226407-1 [Araneus ventricosus]|uniref:Uncharacterized protein n=1 Tax=Araneus ventricosus TaxID=182803 RepID=A0A4Y2GWT2_ARAVE|nr:hypothetical protein AVEN_226407-1 [Araneus ventricosus]